MRELIATTAFKKDIKRAKKRGKDPKKLRNVIDKLLTNEPLERKFEAHRLVGKMVPYWECHIESDWLLVWDEDDSAITLIRMGTHSDLFP